MSGKILEIIKSMYYVVKTQIFFQGEKSEPFMSLLGVRQGDCLSPFLFAMYINDLEQTLSQENVEGIQFGFFRLFLLLYADDITILAETPQGLQKSLDELHTYCMKWKLQVNTNKSMVMVFKRGRRRQKEHWSYGGTEMKCSHTATYLGLTLTPGGSFATTQRTLAEQASKAQFQLNSYLYQFKDIPPTIVYDLFVKMIFPVLNYGGEVWGFHSASDIEKVHLSFMKHLLGVNRSTQNVSVYGEFGTSPMKVLRKIQILKYWLKIVHGKKSLYVSNSYWVMYNDAINLPSKPNWATQVRDMLFHLGFGEAWYAHNVGDIEAFVYLFRQRVYDNYQQDWCGSLNDSSRAITYRGIRTGLETRPYLSKVCCVSHLRALARLITSSHPLRVDTGRWERPLTPYLERKCVLCNKNDIEDEYHFTLICPLYNDIRRNLIPLHYRKHPNMFKFTQLVNCPQDDIIKSLAKYVFKAFLLRSESLHRG